jgi:hypothetical protein
VTGDRPSGAVWAVKVDNNRSNESGGAASERAKETKGQIVLCNPKKTAAAARANTKSCEVAATNKYSGTATARPTNEESAETLVSDEACSRLDRAQAIQGAVGAQSTGEFIMEGPAPYAEGNRSLAGGKHSIDVRPDCRFLQATSPRGEGHRG